jgi:molecular chaperone DnaK (HSP70)
VEIKATAGDIRLGGNDWDQRIVEHTLADIDQVVLTGGAARMPAVGDLIRQLTGSHGL